MVGMLLCQIFNSWSFNSLNLSKSVPSVSSLSPKSPDISRCSFPAAAARANLPKESTNKFGGLHRLQVPWRWWWLCEHRWWGGRKRLLGGRKRLFDPLQIYWGGHVPTLHHGGREGVFVALSLKSEGWKSSCFRENYLEHCCCCCCCRCCCCWFPRAKMYQWY